MTRIKTHAIEIKDDRELLLSFKFDISVTSKWIFTTTIPQEIVKIFESALIDLKCNLRWNYWYFENETCQWLIELVQKVSNEYSNKTLIEEKIVLKYIIATTCTYSFSAKWDIVPNCSGNWIDTEDYQWHSWTENIHANQRNAFWLQVYVKPYYKRKYQYKSWKIKTTYKSFSAFGLGDASKGDDTFYLRWLEWLNSISTPKDWSWVLKEIDYSEKTAKVFVDMIKSICNVNEKIKDFIDPEGIKKLANSSQKLLN